MCLCAFLGFAPPEGLDTDKLDKLDKAVLPFLFSDVFFKRVPPPTLLVQLVLAPPACA